MPPDTPTATVQATATEEATALPEDCWDAQYVADVTIPDGTRLDPGEVFVKTWRVRNTGACAWEGVTLQAKGLSPVDVPEVAVGAEAEVSVQLQAPAAEGEYTAVWYFVAPDGTNFGRLTSVIRVGDPATAVPRATATSAPAAPPPTATSAPVAPQPTATTAAVCECGGDTYNCGDFSRQAQAQACYNYCVSIGRGDIHRLDRDNDGVVCESLP
jgi:hypothetical protein